MAQTKKKRRRKHSGTQAGTVQRRPVERKPQTKEERRELARRRRAERLERPPTLRASAGRAALAALLFGLVVTLVLERPLLGALPLVVLTFLIYIPIGYLIDLMIYRRHQRRKGGGGRARAGESGSSERSRRPRRTRGEG